MPEINLPTKATQDLIKTETDKIASKASQVSVDAVITAVDSINADVDTTVSSRQVQVLSQVQADRLDATISSRASQASLDSLVGGTRWEDKAPNFYNIYGGGVSIPASGSLDVATLTGTFILTHLDLYQNNSKVGLALVVDGVEKPLYFDNSPTASIPTLAGANSQNNGATAATIVKINAPITVNASLILRLVNLDSVSQNSLYVFNAIYHT